MPEFDDLASAWLDGELSDGERARFEELLRESPARLAQFRQWQALHGLLSSRFRTAVAGADSRAHS